MIASFIGTINHFTQNSACSGGAIYAVDNVALIFNGTNNFINNSIRGLLNGNGGVIYTSGNAVLTFNGTNNFINHSANNGGGGAIHAQVYTSLRYTGTTIFAQSQLSTIFWWCNHNNITCCT